MICCISCSDALPYEISGRIDNKKVESLANSNVMDTRIYVASAGGDTLAGVELGKLLSDRNISVIVKGQCISACAEFLLTGAAGVIFQKEPMIGFHWSPIMDYQQYIQRIDDISICEFPLQREQMELLRKKNLNPNFWREIETRLKLTRFEFDYRHGNCPWKVREFKNHLWLPSSAQLNNLWGLEFQGGVCADDFKKCQKKVDRRWKKGTRIVIGDEVYVSKGR